jgi:leader peptidase (prepilin peptidase)/N-methyltransferase
MEIIILVFFGLLGAVIGSFLNVVILRHNTGRGLDGRSMCFSCDRHLMWYELIPILSFILQRGKCRKCKSIVSIQYPLVELGTALLFALIAWVDLMPFYAFYTIFDIVFLILTLFICSILIVIFVYDLYHKIIPDRFALMFGIAAFMSLIVTHQSAILTFPYYLDFIAGPLLALPFYLLWKFSGGRWIGLGDAKLVIGIGWFLGLAGGLSAIALGFWIGAGISILLLLFPSLLPRKHRLSWKSEVPFGPFLILGTIIIYIFPFDFFQISAFLYFLV